MSKKTPEVGDIWKSEDWDEVIVLALPMSWDEYTPSVQRIQSYSCLNYSGMTLDLDMTDFEKSIYLGKSKANISDLFEVKDD